MFSLISKGEIMLANFGALSASLNTEPYIFLETVGRNKSLDKEIGLVIQGGLASWDKDIFPEKEAAAKLLGKTIYPKSPKEIVVPESIDKAKLSLFMKSQVRVVKSLEEMACLVEHIYKDAADQKLYFTGPYGDYLTMIAKKLDDQSVELIMTGLFQKAYPLIRAASDLVITVEGISPSKNRVAYVVTGMRAQEPGKGKAALFGGFRNVVKTKAEGAFFAALREGKEEAGIKVHVDDIGSFEQAYDVKEARAYADILGKTYPSKINYLKTIPTGDFPIAEGGEILEDGSKRVHMTSGFICRIDMGLDIARFNEKMFAAGDDITSVKVVDISRLITDKSGKHAESLREIALALSFGIKHHQVLFQEALTHIKAKGPLVPEVRVTSCCLPWFFC